MRNFFNKHKNLLRCAAFLLVLFVVMGALSYVSVILGTDSDPLRNYSTRSLFYEPDNSIDVLAIGTSDVYSGVSPLEWWNAAGITGYSWGEPAQRVFETYEYLNKIYKHQSPKVVFIEVGDLFRDKTDAQNLDFLVKAKISNIFPIVTYHRNLAPSKLKNFGADPHSVTKGYLMRSGVEGVENTSDYMKPSDKTANINKLCENELKKCIDLCEKNGSKVVLLSIPSYPGWNMQKHNSIELLSKKYNVDYLDLNLELNHTINWKEDTADGGTHLNYKGAKKVSTYLAQYLEKNFDLTDHRGDPSYSSWYEDYEKYARVLNEA